MRLRRDPRYDVVAEIAGVQERLVRLRAAAQQELDEDIAEREERIESYLCRREQEWAAGSVHPVEDPIVLRFQRGSQR